MSLPPIEALHMEYRIPINSDQFIHLISHHKFIHFSYAPVSIDWEELKRAIEKISSESRDRTVQLSINATILSAWLRNEGFSEISKCGNNCGGFQLVKPPDKYDDSLHLSYRRCSIRISRLDWRGGSFKSIVFMSNRRQEFYNPY
ncbi:hypothetical protein PMAYCL1PPCAC_21241 [Pristionchus mayeri]|uniref:Uncharacterized protein n=1 Tax=Pristionchus mayeri TaxID=1317129 RepID=A0AAN5I539_9BILA|nr:hypothetical protein PMAYCL1PPCAC_21241 [Pristionchus mayeri]